MLSCVRSQSSRVWSCNGRDAVRSVRRAPLVTVAAILTWLAPAGVCFPGPARGDCVHYEQQLHWVAGLEDVNDAQDVVLSGTHAYLTSSNSGLLALTRILRLSSALAAFGRKPA